MEFKNDQDGLTSYVLIDDVDEADIICSSLKKLGVLSEAHHSINTLWEKMISSPTNVVIVDIRLMNSVGKIFTNHPMYKSGTTEVIVFHREDDYPLLKLVENKNFFDFLPESVSYDIFLRHTVRKLRKIVNSEQKALESITEIEHLENRLKRTQSELLEASETFQKKMQFNRFMENFWLSKNKGESFLDCFIQSCEKTDLMNKVIIFLLGDKRTTINTYRSESKVVESIAPVPLSKTDSNLNKSFIEKTCHYITRDRLGIESQLVRVVDSKKQVKYLIGFKPKGVESKNINQVIRFFDNFISSEYQSYVGRGNESIFIDEYAFNALDFKGTYLKIDIRSLNNYLKKDSSIFLMNEFSLNFFSGLERIINCDSKIATISSGVFLLSHSSSEIESAVKDYLQKFDYWNYFEDSNQNFSRLIEPEVTVLTKSEVKNVFYRSSSTNFESQTWS